MRCLVVVPSLRRAGAETQAIDLANGLATRGHEVHLCTFESDLDQLKRVAKHVHFHQVLRTGKYNFSFASEIAQIIDDNRIEVVQGVLMFAILAASLARAQARNKPALVGGVHTTINRGLKQEIQERLIYRRVLRTLDAIAFVCENQALYWCQKYPEIAPLSRVIYNGVDPTKFDRDALASVTQGYRASLQVPNDAAMFTCVAGFRKEKGHRLLLEAFSRLPNSAYLVLAGDGDERASIESIAARLGVKDRLRFLGVVNDVRPLVAVSDATVLASTAVETFSMAMLESMALAVPVIAPQIGGLGEAIEQRKSGLLFPVGDVTSLGACMAEVVNDRAFARSMGNAAKYRLESMFTLSRMIDESEALLTSLVK